MKTHTTTKVAAGVYERGGHRIENWSNRDQRVWVVFRPGQDSPERRAFDNKRSAQQFVDRQLAA
jgi:hypothetical protein